MSRALVTGATGLVGSHVVERLVADGWSVRTLVRDPAAAASATPEGVELAAGDIRDAASIARAARGCDAIVHAAAAVTARGGWNEFHAINVRGTSHVVQAAAECGARLLHVSSVAVYGARSRYRDAPTGEDAPLAPLDDRELYARSKRESESLVLGAHAEGRIWACAVRPCVIYGRRDRQFIPRIARVLSRGVFPIVGNGTSTLSIVHAASVADGIARALGIPAAGGRAYNLANDFDVTVARFAQLASEGLDRRVRLVPLSTILARAGFAVLAQAMRVARGPAMAAHASSALDFISRDNPFTSARARRELGWSPPIPAETALPEAFRWWREHVRA